MTQASTDIVVVHARTTPTNPPALPAQPIPEQLGYTPTLESIGDTGTQEASSKAPVPVENTQPNKPSQAPSRPPHAGSPSSSTKAQTLDQDLVDHFGPDILEVLSNLRHLPSHTVQPTQSITYSQSTLATSALPSPQQTVMTSPITPTQ